jgi:lipopolysaccharide export system permease protein
MVGAPFDGTAVPAAVVADGGGLFSATVMNAPIKIIDRYIGRNTLQGFFLVLSLLVVLLSFMELLIQIKDVGKGSFQMPDAFSYVALTVPKRIVDLMPLAALIGSIVALGLLADHQELTAMQAAGISVQRIAFSVLGTSAVLMLAAILMAEFVAPPLDQMARIQRSRAIYGKTVMMSKEGFWVRHGTAFVHVGRTLSGEQAADIEIYELDESGRLCRFLSAAEASIDGQHDWLLKKVEAKTFGRQTVETRSMEEYRLTSFLTAGQVALLQLPPDSLSLSDLWSYIRSLDERAQNSKAYALAFWQKVCLPATTCIMVLLSLTFVFGSTRTRNASQRIFWGMLTGVVFHLANQIIGHSGLILNIPPMVTTLLPVGFILIVALRLLRRAF